MSKNENANASSISDLVIIGSGPAGLTAAIYAARARLNPILLAGEQWGGQLMNTTDVENFPGFPDGIAGPLLMQNMINQAKKFGTDLKYEFAASVDLAGDIKIIKTSKNEYKTKALIIATGSIPKKLGIPGEDKFYGHGVSTCATCDAAFYREKVVTVVGGGDSAMEEATFLARFASKVYLIHRKDSFRASKIMTERAMGHPKIEILYNTEVKEVTGEMKVEGVKLFNNKTNENSELKIDGFFLAIGHIPSTQFLTNQLEMDENGYVITSNDVETNVEGVYVAGEIQDHYYKQAITTAGDGCKAALRAHRWLELFEVKG